HLRVFGWQVRGFRDDPDAGLRPAQAGNGTAKIRRSNRHFGTARLLGSKRHIAAYQTHTNTDCGNPMMDDFGFHKNLLGKPAIVHSSGSCRMPTKRVSEIEG